MTSPEFAAKLRRWYPSRLFSDRPPTRSAWVAAAEITAAFGLPVMVLVGMFVRARLRRRRRLQQAAEAGKASALMPGIGLAAAWPGQEDRGAVQQGCAAVATWRGAAAGSGDGGGDGDAAGALAQATRPHGAIAARLSCSRMQ